MVLDQVWNWILNVPVAIWGSLIAGIMTLAGVIIGQYGLQKRQEKQRDRELETFRTSIIAELRSADDYLRRVLYAAHDVDRLKEISPSLTKQDYEQAFDSEFHFRITVYRATAAQQWFSDRVYQTNADKVGELSPNTARGVIETYNYIDNLYRSLRNLAEAVSHEDLAFNRDIDWQSGAGLNPNIWFHKEQIESTVSRAVIFQKLTLHLLGDTIEKKDRLDVTLAYRNLSPRTADEERIQQYIELAMEKLDLSSVDDLIDYGKDSGDE